MSRRHFTIRVIQLFNPVIAMHMKSHENGGSGRTNFGRIHFENADDRKRKKRKEQESDNYTYCPRSSHVQRI
jgi:hypothetical protein